MLIHSCCADCFLKFYQALSEEQIQDIQVLFYNPNIYPREEYNARLQALKKVVKSLNPDIKIIVSDYLPQEYFQVLKKITADRIKREKNQEHNLFTMIPQNQRCPLCWKLRLGALFALAKAKGISEVSSTLLSSNYQNSEQIKNIAEKLSSEYQIEFYVPQLTQTDRDQCNKGFYKQNYCGCLYSLIEKSHDKYSV